MTDEMDRHIARAMLLAELRTPGIDGLEGFYFAQRKMSDGTIAEVLPLIMGTARLGVGREWGGPVYAAAY